jgi:hypothetical protein
MRDEITALQEQISAKREENDMEEVRRLQDQLREKVDQARLSRRGRDIDHDLESDYEDRIHDRIRAHHEERRQRRRMDERGRSRSSRRDETPVDVDTSGLSDERAIYHMTQIGRKSTILTDKLSKFHHAFTSEEHENFRQQVEEYKSLEKVVAGYLQQTADEFNKAKKLNTKEKRLAQIERAKANKNARKDDEKAAREAARDKFLAIKKEIEAKIQTVRGEL